MTRDLFWIACDLIHAIDDGDVQTIDACEREARAAGYDNTAELAFAAAQESLSCDDDAAENLAYIRAVIVDEAHQCNARWLAAH